MCVEFQRDQLTVWDCYSNEWEGPFAVGMFGKLAPSQLVHRLGAPLRLPRASWGDDWRDLRPIVVEQFQEDESTIEKAEQLVRSLTVLHRPISFEVLGVGENLELEIERGEVRVQFVAHVEDVATLERLLSSHYPNSVVRVGDRLRRLGCCPAASCTPGAAVV
jgi:hypothetical protein